MYKVVVGSENPVKIEATRIGFQNIFPGNDLEVVGVNTPSGVSEQPGSDSETRLGAHNRAANAARLMPEADFWVGIEGGIEDDGGDMQAFAWVVVQSDSLKGSSRTGTFMLPPAVAQLVRNGTELGIADDIVFRRRNSKQGNGAVGILTRDVIDRTSYYTHAVALALIPFINQELFINEGTGFTQPSDVSAKL